MYAIANDLMIGPTPKELFALNDVELAMISLARIDRHVFSIEGGAHKQMIGWHSMYANDIAPVSKTANWCVENLDDSGIESCEYSTKSNETDSDDDSVFVDEKEDSLRPKFAKICIILCGPFTRAQQAIARKKTDVDWNKIKHALKWLSCNNHLYAKLKIDPKDIAEPIVIEKIETAESVDNNVETIYQMRAVFPDGSNATNWNGGCEV
jgi:hypothetical protein